MRSIFLMCLGLILFLNEPVFAQVEEGKKLDPFSGVSEDKRQEFIEIAKELRCPTCTGLSVLESDASFSKQIKDLVKEQVESGKNKDEVLQFFTERYGPWILRSPPKQGFNLLAWAFPLALLILGPVAVWFFVWRNRKEVVQGIGVRTSEEIIAEMEQALFAHKGSNHS